MAGQIKIAIKRLAHGKDLPLPRYKTSGAAGMDLSAAIGEAVVIAPNGRALIPTGFAIALPVGYEAQIRPRSGLSTQHGITLINAPGTIDCDYRGEIKIALVNLSTEHFTLRPRERIAQMIIAPCLQATFEEVDELSATERNEGGFGSTGVRA